MSLIKVGLKYLTLTTALAAPAFVPTFAYAQNAEAIPPAADAEYHANWGLDMINALPAYLKGYTGKGVVVAVIDTGLDVNHPEYAGRVSPFYYNFGDEQPARDVFPRKKRGSLNGHGDHVAGIIGAGRNGFGMQGVAYDSILMPLRAVEVENDDEDFNPTDEAIAYAVKNGAKVINGSYGPDVYPNRDLEQGIPNPNYQILNYQLMISTLDDLEQTYKVLKYAADEDVVMVFAAGNSRQEQPGAYTSMPIGNGMLPLITRDYINSGKIRFLGDGDDDDDDLDDFDLNNPNTYRLIDPNDPVFEDTDFSDLKGSLIVVVSVGSDGKLAPYSNECGDTAEWCITAPGGAMTRENISGGIYSTWPQGDENDGYRYIHGTSMAAPHVAGAAAVVRSAFPYMNARQTIETILTTTTKTGFEDQDKFGQGLLNLGAAIDGPMAFRYAGVFDVDTQGYSSIWSNSISGIGDLTKRGDGILVLSGQNTYQGPTNIVGGGLEVQRSITSDSHVSQAGQLSGSGSVGNVILAKGGKISPGSAIFADNAIGTLTVNGSFFQSSGSTYIAGLSAANGTDHISINGAAILGSNSSLELVRQGAGRGTAAGRYTLLTARDGVIGTYDNWGGSLVTQTPFIDFALDYDSTNVFLETSRSDVAFADIAVTHNQTATATALESQGAGSILYDHMLFLNKTEARQAYDQLSGEAYASIQSSLINNSAYTRTAVYNQLSRSFSKSSGVAETTIGYLDQPNFWMHGLGEWTTQSGNDNTAKTRNSIGGFLTGIDAQVWDNWRFGLLAGYSYSKFRIHERMSSGKSDDYTIGSYAGTEMAHNQGTFAFRSGAAYTWHNINMNRGIAFAGFEDKLAADYKAGTFQIFGELGYKHQTTEQFAIEPYANLAYVHLRADKFSEDGRNGATLNMYKSTMDTALASLGFRISADLNQGVIPVKARADIAWRHAFGDVTPTSKANFTGSDAFTINGMAIGRNTAFISTGLDFQLEKNAVLGVSYQGQFGSGITQNGLNASLKIQF
ncbi:autotransporter domain-containing protein [Pseudochrobactrum saccharolyticum]|uniref:autotransporter domain-containing protein n=1 Tax=Pseudochrobactrum saccharolyticum TaxID=354352 RepID=UPI00274607D3|nr:autotransporter serine protease [Pseudochrobactrum saccharolyticum]MDP8250028.1 autotransporter domain-containing protein [Pseudochrobactrum saccharolyticum]